MRNLQRIIKQGAAQFNASQDPAPEEVAADGAAVPPADGPAPALDAPATVAEDPQPQPEAALATPYAGPRPLDVAPRHDWMDYLSLMLASGSFLLLLYLTVSVLPALRTRLEAALPEQDEAPPRAARRRTTLPEDRYRRRR